MSAPEAVLISGGAGFMGRHLARRLLAAGRPVTLLDLAAPPEDLLRAARWVRGSILDPEAVRCACRGAREVVHLAAKVSDFGPRREFLRLNLAGTASVLEGARRAGARRFVHMSSLAVLDYRRGWRDAGEDQARAGGHEFAYGRSKARAEALVRAAHGAGLETVVVRPGLFPFGPEDRLGSLGLLRAVERRRPVLLDGGRALLGTAYVENLVDGLVLCLERPAAAGQLLHLADAARLTWRELIVAAAAALGVRPNLTSVPARLVEPLAGTLELLWGLLRVGGAPPLTRYRVRTASSDLHVTCPRAQALLGWAPRVPLDEALRRTVAWYQTVGR